ARIHIGPTSVACGVDDEFRFLITQKTQQLFKATVINLFPRERKKRLSAPAQFTYEFLSDISRSSKINNHLGSLLFRFLFEPFGLRHHLGKISTVFTF